MKSSLVEIKSRKRSLLNQYLNDGNRDTPFSMIKHHHHAGFVLDVDARFVQVNSAFLNLYGFSTHEALEMKFHTLIPIEDLDRVLNFFHKTLLGDFETLDCKMKRNGGDVLDLTLMMVPIVVSGEVVGVYCVAKDKTPQKRKEKEVRGIEEIHRVMTENVLDMIVSTNTLGEILYISPSCKAMLGYEPFELMDGDYLSFYHEEDVERAIQDRKRVIASHESGRNSYQVRRKDGSYIWVEMLCQPVVDSVTRNIIEIVSVVRDITVQKKAEEEIWKRKKMFRDLIEHSPDGVIISIENKIQFINQTGLELFGASCDEELLQRSTLELIPPEYHTIARERSSKVTNGEVADFIEYTMIRMDGTTFDAEIKGIPTIYRNEKANYLFIRDLTERKKTQELLLQAEKLNVAGQLAAGIAHEVRNPLTAIKGFLQLLSVEITEKRSYLEIVQSEIGRIEHILTELLTLSKPKNMIVEPVELQSIIHDVKTLIETQAIMNNIKIEIHFECLDALMIQCDKNQLKQVFINFMKNSLEAMAQGGVLTVELVKHGVDRIKVLIKDTGPGIPHEVLQRIGEPFFTTKENGTGLGIMISKQIIENHRGSVQIWSDDKGTIIEIILPLEGASSMRTTFW